ncbi:peptide deformylase [Alphaproteobacteria bacterium]|nr:peptide deformylase [Alphaproteobacteria bacterium]
MTILPIITAPDPRLRIVSTEVLEISNDDKTLMSDMLETMYQAPGVGLSAIQVGVPKRIIVIDTAKDPSPSDPIKLVNPVIMEKSDNMNIMEEGCLSFPEQFIEVERYHKVTIQYLNEMGKLKILTASGFKAVALQHEIDHLDGKLLVDHVSSLKRNIILRKLKKYKNNNK